MFSGIIEETGIITKVTRKKNLSTISVRVKKIRKGIKKGDSVAVNGVCLTVTSVKKDTLDFDVMRETLIKTTLGVAKIKTKVNLERSLKLSDRLHGHFVSGHVDTMCKITKRVAQPNYLELQMNLPRGIKKYIVEKGSVSLDGVSLTVGKVTKETFSIYLIPFTAKVTNLGTKKRGDLVNVETDILAKYVLNS